jgi:hypothetical protein
MQHKIICPKSEYDIFLKKTNSDQIEYYKEKILLGKRPIVLAAIPREKFFYCGDRFIIDGHHKAIAYSQLGMSPAWLLLYLKDDDKDVLDLKMNSTGPWASFCSLIKLRKENYVDGQYRLSEKELKFMPSDTYRATVEEAFKVYLNFCDSTESRKKKERKEKEEEEEELARIRGRGRGNPSRGNSRGYNRGRGENRGRGDANRSRGGSYRGHSNRGNYDSNRGDSNRGRGNSSASRPPPPAPSNYNTDFPPL